MKKQPRDNKISPTAPAILGTKVKVQPREEYSDEYVVANTIHIQTRI